ncbi:MAG: MATE family efflux transporter [Treponemataceae bacterium]
MNKNIEVFENLPVLHSIFKMAVPNMVGMLIVIVYNIADTMFVGWTGDANQVAAVSLAMPVFLLLMAFGNIFAVGGGSLISRTLGEKNFAKVKHISSFCVYSSAGIGLASMIIYFFASQPILSLIGTSENTLGFAQSYLNWIALGSVFIVLQYALGGIIRSEGEAKKAVKGMMIGTIINIVLDPIFILTLGWGVTGAAIATVIGNLCSCLYYFSYFLKKRRYFQLI